MHFLLINQKINDKLLDFVQQLSEKKYRYSNKMSSIIFQEQQSSILFERAKPQTHISILKHIEKPLLILNKQGPYIMPQPLCVYEQKMANLPEYLHPSEDNTKKLQIQQTKLMKMQSSQFEYNQVRKNFLNQPAKTVSINDEGKANKPNTLFNKFSKVDPYYCRFEKHTIRKNNFANVFIPVCGLNLQNKLKNKLTSNNRINSQQSGKSRPYNTGPIVFDSNFQSANLLYVYQSRCQQSDTISYDLIMQNDTNTYGHNQWFFFKALSHKTHQNVKFNIINFIKTDSLFNYGLKPLVYSEKENQKYGIGWARRGQNIHYAQNTIRRQNKQAFYYTLSFEFCFKQAKDWVYFTPSYPYSYTQMTKYIQNLCMQPSYLNCFSIKTIAQTLGKNCVNMITIGTGRKQIQDCKIIWILARQHPTQTTSSYMVEGILKYLLPLIEKAKNQSNSGLQQLHNYVFKIIPMTNVDGVIHGNSRTGLIGLDPNRSWKKPKKKIAPQINQILKEIQSYKGNISMILDLHSHSKKTGCFFYGNQLCHNPKISKIYPTLVCQNDDRFCLKNCRFRGGYKTTARSILFQALRIENVFTVQCSLLGYLKNNRIVQYTVQDYYEMGAKLIQTYLQFQKVKLSKPIPQIIQEYSSVTDQIYEVDSAKSDSSLSDEQYQQVRQLEKNLIRKVKRPSQMKSLHMNDNNAKNINNKVSQKDGHGNGSNSKRTCSLLNHERHTSFKITTKKKDKVTFIPRQTLCEKLKSQSHTMNRKSYAEVDILNQPQQTKIKAKNDLRDNSIRVKRPYIKNLKHIRINTQNFDECKSQLSRIAQVKTAQFGVQIDQTNNRQFTAKQLFKQSAASNVLNYNKLLCVQGNPIVSDFSIHPKNQISLQVSLQEKQVDQNPQLKLQNKILSKLPKLSSLLNQKAKRKGSYKENTYVYVQSKKKQT